MHGMLAAEGVVPSHVGSGTTGADAPVTMIADYNTPVPKGRGNFSKLSFPRLSSQKVVFRGGSASQDGNIYMSLNGDLRLGLAVGSSQPETSGVFNRIGMPWICGDQLVFFASGSTGIEGIYAKSSEGISVVSDTNTQMPKIDSDFMGFAENPQVSGSDIIFIGKGISSAGVYLASPEGLQVVADTNTPMPGGTGNFLEFWRPAVSDGSVVFFGGRPGDKLEAGIFHWDNGKLSTVADFNMAAPENPQARFVGFGCPSISRGTIVFRALTNAGNEGIYAKTGDGRLVVLADLSTSAPGGGGKFKFFRSDPSIDGERVAFRGSSPVGVGLYTTDFKNLVKVIDQHDLIKGQRIGALGLGNGELSGDVISFFAVVDSEVSGIYTMDAFR